MDRSDLATGVPGLSTADGALSTLAEIVGSTSDPIEVWTRSITMLGQTFGADSAIGIELVGEHRFRLVCGYNWSSPLIKGAVPLAPDSQGAYVLGSSTPVVVDDLGAETRFVVAQMLTVLGYSSSISYRLADESGVFGFVGLLSRAKGFAGGVDAAQFEGFVNLVATGVSQAKQRSTARWQSEFDSLTGLRTRPSGLSLLADRLAGGHDTTRLILVDLGGFKEINRTYGFPVADQVLKTVAQRIVDVVPAGNEVVRLGSDEILVVGPRKSATAQRIVVEQILGSIEALIQIEGLELEVSASAGVVDADPSQSVEELLVRLDKATAKAKAKGRGRFVVDSKPGAGTTFQVTSAVKPSETTKANQQPATLADVEEAIAGLEIVFQPIVDVAGDLVAVEALTRGPKGHSLQRPDLLFATAETFGQLPRLELAAKKLAFESDVPHGLSFFVNFEPNVFRNADWIESLAKVWTDAGCRPDIVAELTERSLIRSPGRLLRAAERCRSLGWRIALDDLGVRTESLAALRFLHPDVVKLDLQLIKPENRAHATRISCAIALQNGRRPTDVVAEGIETEDQIQQAEVLGANLLQGYYFGRPAPWSEIESSFSGTKNSPSKRTRRRIASKSDLLHITRHIEAEAISSGTVIVASVQRRENYTPQTARQYRSLARRCGFVGVIGAELPSGTFDGVRTAEIPPGDPLAHEWNVVLISPSHSLALLATEVENSDDPSKRLFRYHLATDPDEVEQAAARLLGYF